MREIVCVSSEAKRDRREVSKRKSVCEQRVSACECACVWVRVREENKMFRRKIDRIE